MWATQSVVRQSHGRADGGEQHGRVHKARWARLYEQLGERRVVGRRCSIARPTLAQVVAPLPARATRGRDAQPPPRRSPNRKVFADEEALNCACAASAGSGCKMLRDELARRHGLEAGARHHPQGAGPPRREPTQATPAETEGTSAQRPVPGDRVQWTPADDQARPLAGHRIDTAQRWQVVGLYPRRTAASTRDFLEHVPRRGMPVRGAARADRPWRGSSSPTGSKTMLRDAARQSFAPRTGPARRTSTARWNGGQRTALEESAQRRSGGPGPRRPARAWRTCLQPPPTAQRPRRQHPRASASPS